MLTVLNLLQCRYLYYVILLSSVILCGGNTTLDLVVLTGLYQEFIVEHDIILKGQYTHKLVIFRRPTMLYQIWCFLSECWLLNHVIIYRGDISIFESHTAMFFNSGHVFKLYCLCIDCYFKIKLSTLYFFCQICPFKTGF